MMRLVWIMDNSIIYKVDTKGSQEAGWKGELRPDCGVLLTGEEAKSSLYEIMGASESPPLRSS